MLINQQTETPLELAYRKNICVIVPTLKSKSKLIIHIHIQCACTCRHVYICIVPDIHITGTLLAVHLMLDKRQLEIIKGLVDMNLGEQIDEFEKPSSVIHDPVAQVTVAMTTL